MALINHYRITGPEAPGYSPEPNYFDPDAVTRSVSTVVLSVLILVITAQSLG